MLSRMIPPEPPRLITYDNEPLAFRQAADDFHQRMLRSGWPISISETGRTAARQAWLYGFGREYDDGRGRVTNAEAWQSWHFYFLARDYGIERHWIKSPEEFRAWRRAMETTAEACGLTSGLDWDKNNATRNTFSDAPHIQWGRCRPSPSWRARALYMAGGLPAVHDAVGAL